MLRTLAYRFTPEIAGDVVCYPLPSGFAAAWDAVKDAAKKASGAQYPPHRSLATALSAVTGDTARLWPGRVRERGPALLITRRPVDPWILSTAVRTWERAVRGEAVDTLAPLIEAAQPEQVSVADTYRRGPRTQPDPPGWVYEVAGWEAARRLAAHPLALDSRSVTLRPDTDGRLLSWDDLVPAMTGGQPYRWAMHVITPRLATLPGQPDPVLLLNASLSRLAWHWAQVKTAWVDRGEPHEPVLVAGVRKAPVDGGWQTTWQGHVATVAQSLGVRPVPDPAEDALHGPPGAVRGVLATSQSLPIGRGVGMRFLHHLSRAADEVFGADARVTLRPSGLRFPAPRKGVPAADALGPAVAAAGHERVHLVGLFTEEGTRERMRRALEATVGGPLPTASGGTVADGRLRVTLQHVPAALIDPGSAAERESAGTDLLADLTGGADVVGIWCPTDPAPFTGPARQRNRDLERQDPKPQLRRLFARAGCVSQFLAVADDVPDPDYRATAALRDLLRATGLVDDRFGALTDRSPTVAPAALVGIHCREQKVRGRSPDLVVSLAALLMSATPTSPWRVLAYHPSTGWAPYPRAAAAFHAGALAPPTSSRQQRIDTAKSYVETALRQLAAQTPLPMVLFANAVGCRGLWPGLANRRLGNQDLPGATLDTPPAIVRVSASSDELPRPTHRESGRLPRPGVPGMTAGLYHLGDDPTRSPWFLVNRSRLIDSGPAGRRGMEMTRFDVSADARGRRALRDDWHAMTAREFVVVDPAQFDAVGLVALAAQLCQQPLSWDGRTAFPAPLHLAGQLDRDHPDYRSGVEPADTWDADAIPDTTEG
jgi:hypothetical protein